MKKVFMLLAIASFALMGIVFAEDMADKDVVVPVVEEKAAPADEAVAAVVEKAAPVAVAVGNKVCPVCGMEIPADMLGKNTAEVNGKVFNVCSPADKAKAMAEPDKYLKIAEDSVAKAAKAAPAADPGPVPEVKM